MGLSIMHIRLLFPTVVAGILSGCSTVSELLVTNIPHFKEGKTSIVVRKNAQVADLYKGHGRVAVAHISTGREGYETPVGKFRVIRKDDNHRSGLYGDYVDRSDRIVKPNVDIRKGGRPPGTHFRGAPMPFYLEFKPSYGLHAGHLPGLPRVAWVRQALVLESTAIFQRGKSWNAGDRAQLSAQILRGSNIMDGPLVFTGRLQFSFGRVTCG